MAETYVVVLEVGDPDNTETLDVAVVEQLVDAVADAMPIALFSPDRYALQMQLLADGPAEALLLAIWRWRDAAGRLPERRSWEILRAEVITYAEFERDRELASSTARGESGRPDSDSLAGPAAGHSRDAEAESTPGAAPFRWTVEAALVRARQAGSPLAVLLVDLEEFAAFVHQAGSEGAELLLAVLTDRLAALERPGVSTARLLGDQFGVLVENTSEDSATRMAHAILDRLSEPVLAANTTVWPKANVGVAMSQPACGADDLLLDAAAALARLKRSGTGGVGLFRRTARAALRPD